MSQAPKWEVRNLVDQTEDGSYAEVREIDRHDTFLIII